MNDFTHAGYTVHNMNSGFPESQLSLGKVASFMAVKDVMVFGFAFHVNSIELALNGADPSESELLKLASEVIKAEIDKGKLESSHEYTFEYHPDSTSGSFVEVDNPAWWVKGNLG